MFKDFDISKFKKQKPPSDGSFTTAQEIKAIAKIPVDKKFVMAKDNIAKAFNDVAKQNGVELDKSIVKKLMDNSVKVIKELKSFYNRPRPGVLAKKMNIKLNMMDIKSAKTPAYPSGHTAQGYLIALVLSDKHPKAKKIFMKLAKDISDSRNMAKVHYKSDSVFGKKLGEALYKHIKNKI
tara:strand:- start:1647 stop:2186 length:540 start_codon:yes stop_codon:yes gene_type:complete